MATHRVFTPDFKLRVVLEVLTGVKRPAQVCREHRLKDSLLLAWRKTFAENAARIFQSPDRSEDAARIAELERVIGRLTVENEILLILSPANVRLTEVTRRDRDIRAERRVRFAWSSVTRWRSLRDR